MANPRNFNDDYSLEEQAILLRAYRLAVVLMPQDPYLLDESVRKEVKSAIDDYMEMRDMYLRSMNREAPYHEEVAVEQRELKRLDMELAQEAQWSEK